MNSSFWHPEQKLWSILNTEQNLKAIKQIFGIDCLIQDTKAPTNMKNNELYEDGQNALMKTLSIKGFGKSKIDSYLSMFRVYHNFLLETRYNTNIQNPLDHLMKSFNLHT